ncbi:hypothetical protein O6P43_032213 [Quillaja saponaria]|uniref:Uncharacterized protein n=1 Tax=Quillaja saponaria TaxID=32244 RepID=A0AAD7KX41_QUISA|nr:hypothetical protein O6P43_032213 [Quillaja saponaria]
MTAGEGRSALPHHHKSGKFCKKGLKTSGLFKPFFHHFPLIQTSVQDHYSNHLFLLITMPAKPLNIEHYTRPHLPPWLTMVEVFGIGCFGQFSSFFAYIKPLVNHLQPSPLILNQNYTENAA